MKKFILSIFTLFIFAGLRAEDYRISFTGTGESLSVETVTAENLTQNKSITLKGTDILWLRGPSLAGSFLFNPGLVIYPNPAYGFCTVEFDNYGTGITTLEIFNINGKLEGRSHFMLNDVKNRIRINGLSGGLYTLKITSPGTSYSVKIVNLKRDASRLSFTHTGFGKIGVEQYQKKSSVDEKVLDYNQGDLIRFIGTSGNYKTIVMDAPKQSKTISFPFMACTDADNNHYTVVQIGTQMWMAENLKTTRYRNGDPVPMVSDANAWIAATTGAFCDYGNNTANVARYGRLYNWYAVTDKRDITPPGWKIPSYIESTNFAKSLVGDKAVGGKLKETGTGYWYSPNKGASNSTGFSALPGGFRSTDGIFYSQGYYGYWWCPSDNDAVTSFGFGLLYNNDSLKFYIGIKNYGFSVRCFKDITQTTSFHSVEAGLVTEAVTTAVTPSGGNVVVPKLNSPIDGLKITIPKNAFSGDQTFKVSYTQIKSHNLGQYFNPVTPLIIVSYGGGYADGIMKVEIPVSIPKGYFAMGFLYNEKTGELEGMPVVSLTENSVVVATRHFSASDVSPVQTKSLTIGNSSVRESPTIGYFVVSAIPIQKLKEMTEIVSDFEPGYDDWEFTNNGSILSPSGICSGMCLSAMWYYQERRENGESKLFHKYDKYTIANYANLWQDNPKGIKLSSMVQRDYGYQNKAYESAIDLLANDKTKDSLSWYAFAYSILQTKQPQFIGIMSSTGGGHVLIANDVWMKDGKLWISDPNHPGNRTLNILYTDKEFEPYYASLDVASNPKNFEYIAYYGKTAIVDWKLVTQRWSELDEAKIGNGVFPNVELWVDDETGETDGWALSEEFETFFDTLSLSVNNNYSGNYAFTVFDAEGYKIVPPDEKYGSTFNGQLGLKPGLNIIGYCIWGKTMNSQGKAVWDWVDFKWVDIVCRKLNILPNPIIEGKLDKEITLKASTMGTAPIDVRYVWNFGDGTPEVTVFNDSIVKHIFSVAGDFDVVVKQYNNLSGKQTGMAKASAKIGYKGFNFGLDNVFFKSLCTKGSETLNEGYGFSNEFFSSRIDPPPVLQQTTNTVTASWDGMYTFYDFLQTYTYRRKGTATFRFGSNDTLYYSFIETNFELSGNCSVKNQTSMQGQFEEIKHFLYKYTTDNGFNCQSTGIQYFYYPGQTEKRPCVGISFFDKSK